MASYVQLRKHADRLFHEGDVMGSLLAYRRLLDLNPHDHAVRLHVGDALARLGLTNRAAQAYAAVSLAHLRFGRALPGVAAFCALRAVQPESKAVLPTLAALYGRGSARVAADAAPPVSPAPPGGDLDLDLTPEAPGELLRSVLGHAARVDEEDEPEHVAPLPILSDLDEDDLARVLSEVTRRRYRDGDHLIVEGETGTSFFLLAHGGARVTREEADGPRTLATVGPGTILGEIALVTHSPRTATVTAMGDVDAIEVPVRALALVAGDRRGVAAALDRFTRERLTRDAVASSRLFRPFLPDRVDDLLALFSSRDFPAGATLLNEGQMGSGLFVLLSGEARATRTEGSAELEIGRVGPRDVVGEMSLLGDRPAIATVTTLTPTIALFIDRDHFDELVERFPEVRTELERLGEARQVVNAFILDEEAFIGADAVEAVDEPHADFYL